VEAKPSALLIAGWAAVGGGVSTLEVSDLVYNDSITVTNSPRSKARSKP